MHIPETLKSERNSLEEIRNSVTEHSTIDKEFIANYLEMVDEGLYSGDIEKAKVRLYDLYNHIRFGKLASDEKFFHFNYAPEWKYVKNWKWLFRCWRQFRKLSNKRRKRNDH